jgi:hypothetical protein
MECKRNIDCKPSRQNGIEQSVVLGCVIRNWAVKIKILRGQYRVCWYSDKVTG